jgi:hypothetical protein
MELVTAIGTAAICGGVLFFLFCAALVFGYLFKQKPQVATPTAPEPPVQATIAHPTAGGSSSDATPGADG